MFIYSTNKYIDFDQINRYKFQYIFQYLYMSCRGEAACVTNETMNHAFQGHSRWLGHKGEF